jgi:hypothetical protein
MLKSTNADSAPEAIRSASFPFDGAGEVEVGWEIVESDESGTSI